MWEAADDQQAVCLLAKPRQLGAWLSAKPRQLGAGSVPGSGRLVLVQCQAQATWCCDVNIDSKTSASTASYSAKPAVCPVIFLLRQATCKGTSLLNSRVKLESWMLLVSSPAEPEFCVLDGS